MGIEVRAGGGGAGAILDSMVEPPSQPHTQALFSSLLTGGGNPAGCSIYCSECSRTLSETVLERLIMERITKRAWP